MSSKGNGETKQGHSETKRKGVVLPTARARAGERAVRKIDANKARSVQRHGHGPSFAQRAVLSPLTRGYMTKFNPLGDRISRRMLGEQAGSRNPLLHSIRNVSVQRSANLGRGASVAALGKRIAFPSVAPTTLETRRVLPEHITRNVASYVSAMTPDEHREHMDEEFGKSGNPGGGRKTKKHRKKHNKKHNKKHHKKHHKTKRHHKKKKHHKTKKYRKGKKHHKTKKHRKKKHSI